MGHRFGKALGLGVCLVLKPYIWYRWGTYRLHFHGVYYTDFGSWMGCRGNVYEIFGEVIERCYYLRNCRWP